MVIHTDKFHPAFFRRQTYNLYCKKIFATIRNHFRTKIKGPEKASNPLILLVIVGGFEPPAYRLGASKEQLKT